MFILCYSLSGRYLIMFTTIQELFLKNETMNPMFHVQVALWSSNISIFFLIRVSIINQVADIVY